MNDAATFIRNHINVLPCVSEDITFGRDLRMFVKVALSLLLICVIRSLSDFLTLIYTGLVILLTVTALYERYEDHIDRHALTGYSFTFPFAGALEYAVSLRHLTVLALRS
ncbi:reticulon B12 [Olea europaea subsp. europaea]|uniref:Reticulon-like protein n=1 Tax=Olea europaea subsp. europaea TaxID=158383 RepID=A0A8S0PQ19_OLEEU|nr:reticulon B12 [Olea europaea subsp. europaea]